MKGNKSKSDERIIKNSTKGTTKLSFKPRPGKSKTVKSNAHTIGAGKSFFPYTRPASTFSAVTVGNVNFHPRYAYNDDSVEDIGPWEKLRQTFSTRKSPITSPEHSSTINARSPRPKNVQIVDEFLENELGSVSQTTDIGVQVSLFHCKDCKRHAEYGNTDNGSSTVETDSVGKREEEKLPISKREKLLNECRDNVVLNCANLIKKDNAETPDVIPKGHESLPSQKSEGTLSFESQHRGFQRVCGDRSPITGKTCVLRLSLCVLVVAFFLIWSKQYFLNPPAEELTRPTIFETLFKYTNSISGAVFSWAAYIPKSISLSKLFY